MWLKVTGGRGMAGRKRRTGKERGEGGLSHLLISHQVVNLPVTMSDQSGVVAFYRHQYWGINIPKYIFILLQSPTQHLKVVQRWPWLLAAMVVERMLR